MSETPFVNKPYSATTILSHAIFSFDPSRRPIATSAMKQWRFSMGRWLNCSPFAYEYALKDVVFGSSNLLLSRCSLLEQKSPQHLLPQNEDCTIVIKVVDLVYEAVDRLMKRNVGANVRRKFLGYQGLEEGSDIRHGWTRGSTTV